MKKVKNNCYRFAKTNRKVLKITCLFFFKKTGQKRHVELELLLLQLKHVSLKTCYLYNYPLGFYKIIKIYCYCAEEIKTTLLIKNNIGFEKLFKYLGTIKMFFTFVKVTFATYFSYLYDWKCEILICLEFFRRFLTSFSKFSTQMK